jgi:hypothetical protein
MKTVRILAIVLIMLLLITRTVSAQSDSGSPAPVPKLTADLLFSVTGAGLSILAFVIPPFRRFQERLGEWTPAFMAGSLLVVAIGYQTVWCGYDMACVIANWQSILLIWGTSFATNAGAYKALVKPAKLREEAARLDQIIAER